MRAALIDLANSQFGNFAVDAKLLTPGAIAPNLAGKDVLGRFVLNGAFATPTVDYKLRAGAIRFGTTGVENLYAEGLARVEAARILLPVHARAGRIVGLNAAVGGLANHARIDGDIAIQMPTILSDNLRIRSDNIDATAIVVANMKTGRYTGGLKGRINNYRVESIGIVDLTTDANLVPGTNGGFGIKGRVVARTEKLFNSGVRELPRRQRDRARRHRLQSRRNRHLLRPQAQRAAIPDHARRGTVRSRAHGTVAGGCGCAFRPVRPAVGAGHRYCDGTRGGAAGGETGGRHRPRQSRSAGRRA